MATFERYHLFINRDKGLWLCIGFESSIHKLNEWSDLVKSILASLTPSPSWHLPPLAALFQPTNTSADLAKLQWSYKNISHQVSISDTLIGLHLLLPSCRLNLLLSRVSKSRALSSQKAVKKCQDTPSTCCFSR